MWTFIAIIQNILYAYRIDLIVCWLHSEELSLDFCYQSRNPITAIASKVPANFNCYNYIRILRRSIVILYYLRSRPLYFIAAIHYILFSFFFQMTHPPLKILFFFFAFFRWFTTYTRIGINMTNLHNEITYVNWK